MPSPTMPARSLLVAVFIPPCYRRRTNPASGGENSTRRRPKLGRGFLLLGCHLCAEGFLSFETLRRADVLDVGRHRPLMTKRIDELAETIAPEHVLWWEVRLPTCLDGA